MKLFLECNPDEVLARVAGVPQCDIVHSHGKGKVSRSVAAHSGVSALVDEDPGSAEPGTLSRFADVPAAHAYDLHLRVDKAQKNRLVVVCPRLEDWVIKTAKAASVNMTDFNLSDNPRELHADVNQRLENWERLLKTLLTANSRRLLHLKALLLGQE